MNSGTVPVFPAPPEYFREYGPEGAKPPPPPLPNSSEYLLFGEARKLQEETPCLEEEGQETLFDVEGNRKSELKKLIVLSFTKFLDIQHALAEDLDQDTLDGHLKSLRSCFVNMIYLANELRAVQAKAEVLEMLANQIQANRFMIQSLEQSIRKADKDVDDAFKSQAQHSVVRMDSDQVASIEQRIKDDQAARRQDELLKHKVDSVFSELF